jgi:hypothetical protein
MAIEWMQRLIPCQSGHALLTLLVNQRIVPRAIQTSPQGEKVMFTRAHRRLTRRSSLTLHPTILLLLLMFPNQLARADEIAIWNFNDSDLLVDHGTGTISTNFNLTNVLFAAGTLNNGRLGDPAGQSLSLQGGTGSANNGRHVTISVSTQGFAGISVSFATQGSGTGFNNNQFQYSIDGVTFIDFGLPYAPAAAFGSTPVVFDLSTLAGLNDNPNSAFRIVFNGATSATGTNRIDNLVVDGTISGNTTTVPEPATLLLLGSGLSTLSMILRRRKSGRRGVTYRQSPTSTNGAQ